MKCLMRSQVEKKRAVCRGVVTSLALALAGMALAGAVYAAPVKIGFVTTLTTPAAVIGEDMQAGVQVALAHLGGEAGGRKLEVIFADDGFKPALGKQKTDRLVKRDGVDFVAGYIWSHVLLASHKSVLDAGKFLISANAGPSQLAGAGCHPNFFSTSWQNDQTPMAMGEVLNRRGVKSLYIMVPNYAAGKNMVAGVTRTFKGRVVGKELTKWGKDRQLDFSAELAKARASDADALFVFYPGSAGGAFLRQYGQAGLEGRLPVYSVFTVDAISLPKFQEAGMEGVLGSKSTMFWSADLDNAANRRFVRDFRERYGRYPSFYAAQAYDSILLIGSAVEGVGGDLGDEGAVRAALRRADFDSVRGRFEFGRNGMPVQDFYLREVVEDGEGNWTTKVVDTVYEKHRDPYEGDCGN